MKTSRLAALLLAAPLLLAVAGCLSTSRPRAAADPPHALTGAAVGRAAARDRAYAAARAPAGFAETLTDVSESTPSTPLSAELERPVALAGSDEPPREAHALAEAPAVAAPAPAPLRSLDLGDFTLLPIFYGTDRAPVLPLDAWRESLRSEGSELVYYGPRLTAAPAGYELGLCWVTVPTSHVPGQVERPSLWRLETREDLGRHFTVNNLEPLDPADFRARLNRTVAETPGGHVFIFVHGFNVQFHEAAMRAAQLAHDWEFPGPTVLFSWASQGGTTPTAYHDDGQTASEASARHFRHFLAEVMTQTDAPNLHVIAHSMGNRVVTAALAELPPELHGRIAQVVLAAPDVRADIFRRCVPRLQTVARRVTLYASSHDKALQAARRLSPSDARAGQGGPDLILEPGLDSIDASQLDTDMLGHGYLSNAREMLRDIRRLLLTGDPPDRRDGLLSRSREGRGYWVFASTTP